MELTDSLFDSLMSKNKIFEEKPILPSRNQKAQLSVSSTDGRDSFVLDIDRSGKIEMKSKVQERYAGNQILVRVDINSPPHTNPDSTKTSRNHIHVYREGYNLSWAYDIDTFRENLFSNLNNFNKVFIDFCIYCNIKIDNNFQMVL